MPGKPAAFMSYVRFNDQHDDGLLSQFRERLGAEVRAQTGEEFAIFQDRNDVAWGQNWQQRIDEALDAVTLLLVIVTPSLFRSPACRSEVTRFLERERDLGRQDLILPVYYISAQELDDPELRETDEMARVLASRQHAEWRELRFEPFTSPVVRKATAQLASRMRDTFWKPPAIPRARSARVAEAPEEAARATERTGGEARRSTAKSEPPTHVVDPYHRGDFTTVGAAIEAAQPGDRILVRPGLYEEGLVIDKPLEVLGDGPVADIQIRTGGADALMFQASIGRVTNLTLRQTGGRWYGVDITQGRLELEGCDISSQGLAGVAIRNGADPRLRRNQIHDSKQSGVHVYDSGLGTLEDNDITGNTSGVTIKEGGNPTLRRNQIHDNKQAGVHVYDSGLGTLEDNDITGNTVSGVAIQEGGNPTLRRNQIHDNKQSGVHVYESGLGMLEDNDITGNTFSGVAIQEGGNPTLRRNQIHDNSQAGVHVYESGLGMLEDNDITGNTLSGVTIKTRGKPTLRANRINGNGYWAMMIYKGGGGVIEGNDLRGNSRGVWDIANDCKDNVSRARNKE
ncbi:right-handed parallel beta-helix repeat-containing protein [Streptomyces sp. NPDC002889]|uniref:right-handed parallel beta-helix repeat-containing protein n=1 Tax=Streptomyces sp. NPDC002889 TaxID=3364669 RepID=UPI0036D20140